MGLSTVAAAAVALLAWSSNVYGVAIERAAPALTNADTSLTFIYQNNLNASDDVNHIGAILLDPMTSSAGAKACAALGESLITEASLKSHAADFFHSLSYLEYSKRVSPTQSFYIADGVVTVHEGIGSLQFGPVAHGNPQLPVLCTQSSSQNSASNAVATSSNEVTISSNSNTYIGFRNQKSFRFIGVPYANPTGRFEYSTPYSAKGQTIQATAYGPICLQEYAPTSSEDCLFINIKTPYVPKAGSTKNLRPVIFSIYGGWVCVTPTCTHNC